MDMLLNVMLLHLKPSEIQRFLSPMFVDPWSEKIRSPNYSALNPLTHDLSGLGFVESGMSQ